MRPPFIFFFLFSPLLLLFRPDPGSVPQWDLWKEKEGIRIYTRSFPGTNVKGLKMETMLEGRLDAYVELLRDWDAYEDWIYSSKNARVLETHSPYDMIYYVQSDFPWPLQDRDLIMKNRSWQDSLTHAWHSHSVSIPDHLPEKKGFVRIRQMEGEWVFTPVAPGKVHLKYWFHSDPGGVLPAWLVNMALDVGPMKTLRQMKAIVKNKKYQEADLFFLHDPFTPQ